MQHVARRWTAVAVLTALTAALVVLLGPLVPAAAAAEPVELRCTTSVDVLGDYVASVESFDVSVVAPGSAENGTLLSLGWEIDELPHVLPVATTGVSTTVTAQIGVSVGGGPVQLLTEESSSPSATVDLDAREPLPGDTTLTFQHLVSAQPGDVVTVTAGGLVVDVVSGDDGLAGAGVSCEVVGEPPVLASVSMLGEAPDCVELGDCDGTQVFVGDPPESVLSLDTRMGDDATEPVVLPTVETSGETVVVDVTDVGLARVADRRPAPLGWTLTAALGDPLTHEGEAADIPAEAVSLVDVSCGQTPGATGSAPVTKGSGGTLDDAVLLCTSAPGAVGSTGAPGGQWDVTAGIEVEIAPFAAAGRYSGTIVLTLV